MYRDVGVADLGVHRLKDLAEADSVFQLTHPFLPEAFPALRTVDAVPGNLPTLRSSFVGRSGELSRLEELLGSRRLITLTGVGGVGKTRLALQAAADGAGRYPGGVWLIELARTGDPASVVTVAGVALGVTSSQGRSVVEAVCAGDAAAAEAAMRTHLRSVIEALPEVEAGGPRRTGAR